MNLTTYLTTYLTTFFNEYVKRHTQKNLLWPQGKTATQRRSFSSNKGYRS